MGCQKLSYGSETDIPIFRDYEQGRALEKSEVFLRVYRKKTATGEKKGTDYYPFGHPQRMSQTNEETHYRYSYQGQFAEEDEETGWNSFELRNYDSKIGRWISPDPYGQYWSPYLAMGNNPINQIDPDGGFSGGGDPPVVQSIGYQQLAPDFNFADVLVNTAPGLAFGTGTLMLSDVLVEGSRMSWVREVWYDLTESDKRGGIEFFSTSGTGGAVYHVAGGQASYGITNPGDALIAFDKFGKARFTRGSVLKKTNIASTAKGAAGNGKFGLDALKKTHADKGLKNIIKPALQPKMVLIKKDSTIDLLHMKQGKVVVETVYEYDTIYVNNN